MKIITENYFKYFNEDSMIMKYLSMGMDDEYEEAKEWVSKGKWLPVVGWWSCWATPLRTSSNGGSSVGFYKFISFINSLNAHRVLIKTN